MTTNTFQSTYHEHFLKQSRFPSNKVKLHPRCFPICQPTFPHRRPDGFIPIALLGFNTQSFVPEQLNDNENKNRTLSPQEKHLETPNPKEIHPVVIEELVKLGTYTPTSQLVVPDLFQKWQTNKKAKEPLAIEQKRTRLDYPIRLKGPKQDAPELWQKIGCTWDKVQERKVSGDKIQEHIISGNQDLIASDNRPKTNRLLQRPRISQQKKVEDEIENLYKGKVFRCNVPGYGGYQPPIPIPMKNIKARTTSSVTYRKHSPISYCLPKYGHNGLMSRTVTLTEPFNPFNKVTMQRICIT